MALDHDAHPMEVHICSMCSERVYQGAEGQWVHRSDTPATDGGDDTTTERSES